MAATFNEIVEALRDSGLSDEAIRALAHWADFMLNNAGALEDIATSDALLEQFQAGLLSEASAEAIKFARDMAKRSLDELAKGLELSELKKLGKEIADAIEAGIHPHEAARKMDSVKGLDARRAATLRNYEDYLDALDPALPAGEWERRREAKYQKLLRDRKRDIAQTEMREATETANLAKAEKRGATHAFWSSEGGSKVCPICQKNEAEGIVAIGHRFKSGDTTPPGHPGKCRCSLGFIFTPGQLERMGPLMDARIAATAAAIESGVDPEPRPPV